jgi:hypothetical protein
MLFFGMKSLPSDNQIICDCDLAWLICDYRSLLPYAVGGSCVNGTSFNTLSPYGFRSCLSKMYFIKFLSKWFNSFVQVRATK